MRTLFNVLLASLVLISYSCKSDEMEINTHLKEHSTRFEVKKDQESADDALNFGTFSSFDKEFALAWMQSTGIDSFFSPTNMYTFSVDNHSNYIYDIVASPIQDPAKLLEYAQNFSLPLDATGDFEKAYVAYMYAPHDEYSMIFIQYSDLNQIGYLSNGFEQYEVLPVMDTEGESAQDEENLAGYQFKLNGEFVGSLQTTPKEIFRMSNEFCDATEMVLACIASTILKCDKL